MLQEDFKCLKRHLWGVQLDGLAVDRIALDTDDGGVLACEARQVARLEIELLTACLGNGHCGELRRVPAATD